jgi:deoxyribodipyrimidine photo-lyase
VQARDEQVDEAVRAAGATVQSLDDQTIVPPDGLRTGSGGYYTVFTPYRRRWTEVVKASWPIRLRDKPKRQQRLSVGREPVETITFHTSRYWPAGEREAERRLSKFIEQRIGAYDKQRDYPAVDGTSTLSPYLAAGCISARQCLVAADRANGGEIEGPGGGATTWISELIWREFYRHVMVGFRRVSMNRPFKLVTERLKWSDDEARFEAWREGRTGVPIVDAAMRQLHATGWMHNRLRMITAMYLTKDLRIDWRRGERHFMQHLVDGDLASNNGGWQWSASTGTDSVPYFRIFNPYTQGERFDANGEFVRRWLPELKDVEDDLIHDPTAWPLGMHERTGYPRPIVDHAAARLEALAMFKAIEG